MLNIFSCPYLSSVHSLWWNISIPFPHFLIGLFVFSLLNFESSLCILDSSLLLDLWFKIIFSQSVSCFFHPFNRVFYRTEVFCFFVFIFVFVFVLMWSNLSIFTYMKHVWYQSKNFLPICRYWRFLLIYFKF